MDVFLPRQQNGTHIPPSSNRQLLQSEPLRSQSCLELADEVARLKRRGVKYVSVRRQQVLRVGQQGLLHMLAANGIRVGAIGYAGGFTGGLGRSFEEAVQDTRRALDLAAELQARSLVILPGSRRNHIYNHADRTIRLGLERCLDDALRYRINLQVALNTVIGGHRDVFQPEGTCPLDWIQSMDSHRICGLMVLRGNAQWNRLPDCWRRCLTSGGTVRISRGCRRREGTRNVLAHMVSCMNQPASVVESVPTSLPLSAARSA